MTLDAKALLSAIADSITVEKAEAIGRAYEIRLAGRDDRYTLDLTGAAPFLREGGAEADACGIGLHVEDLEDLLERRTSLRMLFTTNRLRVFGNIGDAMKLEAIFED